MLCQSPFTLKDKLSLSQVARYLHFPLNTRTRTRARSPSYTLQNSFNITHKLCFLSSRLSSSSKDLVIADNSSTEVELLEKPTAAVPNEEEATVEETLDDDDDDAKNGTMASYLSAFSTAPYLEENTVDEWEPSKVDDVEFYDPKLGDLLLGVVVSGNAHRIDVNIGSDVLATMLVKEVLPLYDQDMKRILCELPREKNDSGFFFAPGTVGIVKNEEALSPGPPPGRPVVDVGTVICAEVLGRTLGGKPLLSSRRVTRHIAWQRVRQIKQLNEPIDIYISEWNTGGLVTRIEGLRAFLPKIELVNKPFDDTAALKANVGRQASVLISRLDEENGELIVSEREAWGMKYLCEGTLLEGSIRKVYSYGAHVRVDGTSISGLLHISNISHVKVRSVKKLFSEGEKVKVMVINSMFTDKISF
ncbi:hypothetical protein KI387_009816, partial [Taxus chinensis]